MKLYKEGPAVWAGRTRLDTESDIDIEFRKFPCGKSHTIINICKTYCRDGLIMDWTKDYTNVSQWSGERFMGNDRINQGHADLFSFTGQPDRLHLQLGLHSCDIKLEFES